jgi:hypothetical protein
MGSVTLCFFRTSLLPTLSSTPLVEEFPNKTSRGSVRERFFRPGELATLLLREPGNEGDDAPDDTADDDADDEEDDADDEDDEDDADDEDDE